MAKIFKNTSGSDKLWNYFLYLLRREDFINNIAALRKKYGIPDGGYDIKKDKKIYRMYCNDSKKFLPLEKDMEEVCDQYDLYYFTWDGLLLVYLLFGSIKKIQANNERGLCMTTFSDNNRKVNSNIKDDKDNKIFPVSIKISPYASERDILDYIRKSYRSQINPFQKVFTKKGVKIGALRTKDVKKLERNDYIYHNRKLKLTDLAEKIYDRFGEALDQGHIGKIISIESKRRQKV